MLVCPCLCPSFFLPQFLLYLHAAFGNRRTDLWVGLQCGHVYPSPGAPLSEQVVIDLSENPQELLAAEGDVYPLIFRLETISDKGLADGHVLEVLVLVQGKCSACHERLCQCR